MYIFVETKHGVPLTAETRKSICRYPRWRIQRQAEGEWGRYVRHARTKEKRFQNDTPTEGPSGMYVAVCGIAGSRDRDTVGFCMEAQQRFCLPPSVPFMCVLALPLVACARSNGRKDNDPLSDPSRELPAFLGTFHPHAGRQGGIEWKSFRCFRPRIRHAAKLAPHAK